MARPRESRGLERTVLPNPFIQDGVSTILEMTQTSRQSAQRRAGAQDPSGADEALLELVLYCHLTRPQVWPSKVPKLHLWCTRPHLHLAPPFQTQAHVVFPSQEPLQLTCLRPNEQPCPTLALSAQDEDCSEDLPSMGGGFLEDRPQASAPSSWHRQGDMK